ncbi:hypothetical protein [Parapedobacter tibetensis]|uniref:hypothetical protein n=1 Tax=Parapedobacter tibetensis TaxID=2972951 RepID=UPI00214D9C56|nr:hypothetical protein [Parapedobacter tibetensis]
MIGQLKKSKQHSVFKIFSFYNHLVNAEVPLYQQKVFNSFGYSINQLYNNKFNHGDFLNHVCRTVTDTDYLIIFDIDCIPVHREWLHMLLKDLIKPSTIVGAAQTANHLDEGKNLYVSPFFFAISTTYLKKLHYPDMRMTDLMDAGQNLTNEIRKNDGNIRYWWPTDIEEEMWDLYDEQHPKFGLGTTYNNAIYHAFYSRDDLSSRFIRKCQYILRHQTAE